MKKDLRKQGLKAVPDFESLFIDRAGRVFDQGTGIFLTPKPQNRVLYRQKILMVPKLLLSAFRNEPYTGRRHIRHIDGDKSNISLENLCYVPEKETIRIDPDQLIIAIRCYFQISKRFKARDLLRVRMYLQEIAESRGFMVAHKKTCGIKVFKTYMDNPSFSIATVAGKHGIAIRKCTEIVNPLIKKLTGDILADLESGALQVLDFKPRRKPTKKPIVGDSEYLKRLGVDPEMFSKKKTTEQIVKEWKDRLQERKKEYENRMNSPSQTRTDI